jgi:hypothetical protein
MKKPVNGRNKGAAAEREFSRLVFDGIGVRLARNLEQSRAGGCDLIVTGPMVAPAAQYIAGLSIEIKRYAQAVPSDIRTWWEQATAQAIRAEREPMLAYKLDRRDWAILVPLHCLHRQAPRDYGFALAVTLTAGGWFTLVMTQP